MTDSKKPKEEKSNTGCLIVGVVAFIIIGIINSLKDSTSVAEIGKIILIILGLVIAYFVGKFIKNLLNNESNKNGHKKKIGINYLISVIGGFIILLGINYVGNDFDISYLVGFIFIVLSIIALGIYIYSNIESSNDPINDLKINSENGQDNEFVKQNDEKKKNSLIFHETLTIEQFKKQFGVSYIDVSQFSLAGELYFTFGSKRGVISTKGLPKKPMVSYVTDESGESFWLLHEEGQGAPTIATF
jgi:Na+-transporting methylmalonyl-CoA/oxaloacetate decarboxylase gamma subunit